ncbi:MAG: hypothetical protein E7491_00395 [Ruminococcaceae bacterium]|nr:hypothetical protein [Oscillospiraceae bacterium]
MKMTLLIVFGVLSCLVSIGTILLATLTKVKKEKGVLTPVHIGTIGVFISAVLIFIPIYYTSYEFGDSYSYIRPVLLSIHNALRLFILDGDFEIIIKSLSDQGSELSVCFSLFSALLYVVAPVLTFGNVLTLFKNVKGEIRYAWNKKKKHYILSELNERSAVLAKSIKDKDNGAVIVFASVAEGIDYELIAKAKQMKAICLKKDILNLDIVKKKGEVEVFLIGNDESKNVSQAVKITNDLNEKDKKYNVKVFAFSQSRSSAYIIDSVRYDNLLNHKNKDGANEFKLRRINERRQLVWKTLPQMKLFDLADENNKTLSVLIAGMGSYGMEFFKALAWYCQFEGYRLQMTIVDKEERVEKLIKRQCPEFMEKGYDIKVLPKIDMETSDFDDLLLYTGDDEKLKQLSERIEKTNLAIVSLGDDELNIDVAVHLRSLFDKKKVFKAGKDITLSEETVDIYAIVYDEQKSGILHQKGFNKNESNYLLNHKDIPYHIHFIGGMSTQFSYDNIYEQELEQKAYRHHVSWVDAEEKIYKEWRAKSVKTEEYEWYFMSENTEESKAKAKQKYEKYEYYRLSSIAKELYQQEIENNKKLKAITDCLRGGELQTCNCENCVRRKRSEHMRWNAYTRSMGYSFSEKVRADRAKLHDNLCEWDKLSELDRLKD